MTTITLTDMEKKALKFLIEDKMGIIARGDDYSLESYLVMAVFDPIIDKLADEDKNLTATKSPVEDLQINTQITGPSKQPDIQTMGEPPKTKNISRKLKPEPRYATAFAMIATGSSIQEVSDELGVHHSLVGRMRKSFQVQTNEFLALKPGEQRMAYLRRVFGWAGGETYTARVGGIAKVHGLIRP